MTDLQVFIYGGEQLRTVARDDGLWWVLRDVCRVLGMSNPTMVAGRLDDDEKGVSQIYTPGGPQEMTIINEPGLYAVILRSDKPEARQFKRWVTHEVLPSIRKTGAYGVTKTQLDALEEARRDLQQWRDMAADAEGLCSTACRRYEAMRKHYDKARRTRDDLRRIVTAKEQRLSAMVAELTTA